MPDVTYFNVDGEKITVKDTQARTSAENANNAANSANSTANQNKTDIAAIKKLSRLTVSYNKTEESIDFTNLTH